MDDITEKLLKEAEKEGLKTKKIELVDIVFEDRIKLLCFHCKNYNQKWTCPNKIISLDYEKIIKQEYSNGLIVYVEELLSNNLEEVRYTSTNKLHKGLLHLEKILYENNIPTKISFIGGSCKLCKKGCNPQKCSNPYLARIPLEATGCNVIETLKKVNIEVQFPPKDFLGRYGLLLY